MSYYSHCLRALGLTNDTFTQITRDGLKKAYKDAIMSHHPDRGGSQSDINNIKNAFEHLGAIMDPGNSGRGWIQETIDDPDTLKNNREEIASNITITELIKAQIADEKEKHKKFNEEFEKSHIQPDYDSKGYDTWLATDRPNNLYETPAIKKQDYINENNFNEVFEHNIKRGSHVQPTPQRFIDLAIKPYIDNNDYTLTTFQAPHKNGGPAPLEYTDIYSAFNENNTITDKVSFDDPRIKEDNYDKRLKSYIKERDNINANVEEIIKSYSSSKNKEQVGAFITDSVNSTIDENKPRAIYTTTRINENPEDDFIKSITSRQINEAQKPIGIPKNHCGVPQNTCIDKSLDNIMDDFLKYL